jgi:hypothetical protein
MRAGQTLLDYVIQIASLVIITSVVTYANRTVVRELKKQHLIDNIARMDIRMWQVSVGPNVRLVLQILVLDAQGQDMNVPRIP